VIHTDCDSSEEEGGDVGSTSGAEDEDTEVRPTQVAPKHPGGRKPRNRLELINENKKLKRQIRNMRLQRSLWGTVKRYGPAMDIEKRSDAVIRLVDECGHLYEKSPRNRETLSLEAGLHVNCLREAGVHFEKMPLAMCSATTMLFGELNEEAYNRILGSPDTYQAAGLTAMVYSNECLVSRFSSNTCGKQIMCAYLMADQSNKAGRAVNVKPLSCLLDDDTIELNSLTADIAESKKAKESGERTIASLREQLTRLARAHIWGMVVDKYGVGEARKVMISIDQELKLLTVNDLLSLVISSKKVLNTTSI
jgi:hypothetical protein